MIKHKRSLLRSGLLSLLMISTLASCRGGGDETGGGNKPDTSGGDTTPTNTHAIMNLDSLADDLILDENGKAIFEEEVNLKVWCIIGDPDQKVFNDLVTKFNNEYSGLVHLNMTYVGHFDFYNNLQNTFTNDKDSMPDVLVMHNEKTAEYADRGYLLPLDEITKKTTIETDYSSVYENIDRVTMFNNKRYAVPMDAHGFVTSIRQDIVKKNELGFDGNTRFIPNNRQEYQQLLEGLRNKADAGELWTRNLNKGQNHAWKKADKNIFYPEYFQSTDPDGLSALYANNGKLADATGTKITFHENEGFKTYILDQVRRFNNRLMSDASGGNAESFGAGNIALFPEGPWWVSQQYTLQWNNVELTKAGEKGVTAEDAADPIYSKPYIASRPTGWWTTDENKDSENGKKWYGNGHAISLTNHITSAQSAAAAMTFINWFTQGKDSDTDSYHLATWCNSGHIPAYKNVYDSEEYKNYLAKNMTLRALGNPSDIVAMEGLAYETTIFNSLSTAISLVQSQLKTSAGCTEDDAVELIKKAVEDGQASLDLEMLG